MRSYKRNQVFTYHWIPEIDGIGIESYRDKRSDPSALNRSKSERGQNKETRARIEKTVTEGVHPKKLEREEEWWKQKSDSNQQKEVSIPPAHPKQALWVTYKEMYKEDAVEE